MNIEQLQAELNKQGYGKLVVDGDFGPKTQAAFKAFQKAKGIYPSGEPDDASLFLLFGGRPVIVNTSKPYSLKPPPTIPLHPLRTLATAFATSQEGVREATGQNDGQAVEIFLRSVGLGKGYSWCMAFVYWAYDEAAKKQGRKNPLIKTGGVLRQWNEISGNGVMKTKIARADSIFIMDFGGGQGHTGIVTAISTDGKSIHTIEGNTNSGGSRNGDGVYRRIREISSIKGFIHID